MCKPAENHLPYLIAIALNDSPMSGREYIVWVTRSLDISHISLKIYMRHFAFISNPLLLRTLLSVPNALYPYSFCVPYPFHIQLLLVINQNYFCLYYYKSFLRLRSKQTISSCEISLMPFSMAK